MAVLSRTSCNSMEELLRLCARMTNLPPSEWQDSLPPRKQYSVSSKDCQVSILPSQIPVNVSIVYSDAAWISSTCAGGLSWICTDSGGTYRFQGTDTRYFIASALAAEALTLKADLSQDVSSGIKDVICVSDSKFLIDLIAGNKSMVALRGILHDISVLSSYFTSISFCFISRVCNEPANRLLKTLCFCFQTISQRLLTLFVFKL
ncbi:hypothetical protein Bca4012_060119 [Brassica carinata]